MCGFFLSKKKVQRRRCGIALGCRGVGLLGASEYEGKDSQPTSVPPPWPKVGWVGGVGTASVLDIAVGAVVVGPAACSPHQWWSAAFSEEESMELAPHFCFSLSECLGWCFYHPLKIHYTPTQRLSILLKITRLYSETVEQEKKVCLNMLKAPVVPVQRWT